MVYLKKLYKVTSLISKITKLQKSLGIVIIITESEILKVKTTMLIQKELFSNEHENDAIQNAKADLVKNFPHTQIVLQYNKILSVYYIMKKGHFMSLIVEEINKTFSKNQVNLGRTKKFNISFYVIFDHWNQSIISGRENGY